MKKLALLATSVLTLVGMVACGPTESKTEWTTEEMALMTGDNGYLAEALPFYKAKFTVEEDDEIGAILLQGNRKASKKDVDNYVALLTKKSYKKAKLDNGDTPFESYKNLATYTKPIKSKGQATDYTTAVAVALDGDSNLVVYATIYLDLGLDGMYYASIIEDVTEFVYTDLVGVPEQYVITPTFASGTPETATDDVYSAAQVDVEGSPWIDLNINGAFSPFVAYSVLCGDPENYEAEYDAFVTALDNSGMTAQAGTGQLEDFTYYFAQVDSKTTFVTVVGPLDEEMWVNNQDGSHTPGFELAYFLS